MLARLIAVILFASTMNVLSCLAENKKDTLISFSDIKFDNENEKALFDTLQNRDDIYYFTLSCYANPEMLDNPLLVYTTKYKNYCIDLSSKLKNKTEEKFIKALYKETHSRFLKKYNEETTFEEIFTSGDYNCVTSSILYAVLLKKNDVNFEIKETSTHVKLVAFSKGKTINLETTNPVQGYMVYNQSFKERFVEYLKVQKLISANDLKEDGLDAVFDKFYFNNKNITLQQLVALQYYNNGICLMEKLEYSRGLSQFMKSYYLYPSEKVKYFIYSSLLNLITKANYFEQENWRYYGLLTRFNGSLVSEEQLKGEFGNITNKLLVEKTDTGTYTKAYKFIAPIVKDSSLLSYIHYLYNFEFGRYLLLSEKVKASVPYFEKAYQYQPENYQVQKILFEAFMTSVYSSNRDNIPFEEIERFYTSYPKLSSNTKLIQVLFFAYLSKAVECFDLEKMEDADQFLLKFENLRNQYSDIDLQQDLISETYTKPAAYYFKHNNNKKAREYINRGLRYAPNSYRLKESLRIIK